MNTISKSIILLCSISLLNACKKDSQKEKIKFSTVGNKQSILQSEIQKLLADQPVEAIILIESLQDIPQTEYVSLVKEGVDFFESKHGKKPAKKQVLHTLHLLNSTHQKISLAKTKHKKRELLREIETMLKKQLDEGKMK